jgi:hypothetical protein
VRLVDGDQAGARLRQPIPDLVVRELLGRAEHEVELARGGLVEDLLAPSRGLRRAEPGALSPSPSARLSTWSCCSASSGDTTTQQPSSRTPASW